MIEKKIKRKIRKAPQTKEFLETVERLSNIQLLEQMKKRDLITGEELEKIIERIKHDVYKTTKEQLERIKHEEKNNPDLAERIFEAVKEDKRIISLYDHYKNTSKKLKIVCDWDEVIQSAWPYSYYLGMLEEEKKLIAKHFTIMKKRGGFATFFNDYWQTGKTEYRSRNPSDIYHHMPFLTIAEDLLKLIKEDKVEKLIFLSASDDRKREVFEETFLKFDEIVDNKTEWVPSSQKESKIFHKVSLYLMTDFSQYASKNEWIRKNAWDYDIFIDDSPEICESMVEYGNGKTEYCSDCNREASHQRLKQLPIDKIMGCENCFRSKVFTPYYPTLENQHDKRVIFIKQEVSNLKKEDFIKEKKEYEQRK